MVYGIFFVVAQGTTIYDKLQKDLGDPSNPKYVFKGFGFFLNPTDIVMDESHHYRVAKGMAVLDNLHPMLGLELTATPLWEKGTKQVLFKNVVYEYH